VSISEFTAGLRHGELASSNFTIVANSVARDRNLSYAAKGLFLNLVSHAANFRITEEFLASQSTDGLKTVRRLLGELRAAGYVYRGERSRYPKGTRNAVGKDISGALGPYTWYVTDKPEEIAIILARYATETAGRDNVPSGDVAATSLSDTDPDDGGLPPVWAGSSDQREQGVSAGEDNRPEPTGGSGRSIEDQFKKNMKKNSGGAVARPRTPATRKLLPDSAGGCGELELGGDPSDARMEQEPRVREEANQAEEVPAKTIVGGQNPWAVWDAADLLDELARVCIQLDGATGKDAFDVARRMAALRAECRRRELSPAVIGAAELGLRELDGGSQPPTAALVGGAGDAR